jgi:hypothetical protein
MTLKQRCQAGEAKLEQVSTALLDPRPEILDRCEADLQDVIDLLEGKASPERDPADSPAPGFSEAAPSDKSDLLRLRHRIRLLALQVQQATNLCQGWAQLSLSQGYTDQGKPVLQLNQPQASYEV